MGLFYTASPTELLQIRNKIFLEFGLPILQKKGFQKSPFSTAWFGRSENVGFSYELCRLVGDEVEMIFVHIVRGDSWIQISLNIFKVQPRPETISQLDGTDGMKFQLPPNSMTEMRLKSDDVQGLPILNYDHMFKNHKIRSYYTRTGLAKRVDELGEIIESDMNNIDHFIKRWHKIHQPHITTWEGNLIKQI